MMKFYFPLYKSVLQLFDPGALKGDIQAVTAV